MKNDPQKEGAIKDKKVVLKAIAKTLLGSNGQYQSKYTIRRFL